MPEILAVTTRSAARLPRFSRRRGAAAAAALAMGVAGAATPVAAEATAQDVALAEALFRDGKQLMAAGRLDLACPKLEESMRVAPGGGTALNVAACHEGQGRVATAWAEFAEALGMAHRDGRSDREQLAKMHLDALEPRLPRVTLALHPAAEAPGLEVKIDGVDVRRASLGTAMPLDPGQHRVLATAPGHRPWEVALRLVEAEHLQVTIGPLAADGATKASAGGGGGDRGRSHAGQIGATARLDVDGKGRGVATVVTASYGLGNHVELGLGGIAGKTGGVYAGASFFVLAQAWKPLFTLGVPVFFSSGVRPGVHGAGGLVWDPDRHFGFMMAVGIEYFPSVPMGYDKLIFVPSAAVQGRL